MDRELKNQEGITNAILIIVILLLGVILGGMYYFHVKYAYNPLVVYQDSYVLSNHETQSDILDRASRIRFVSLAFQAKKLKQESGSYAGFCELPFLSGENGYAIIDERFCVGGSDFYVVSGSSMSGGYVCVDDSDIVRKLDINLTTGETKCPIIAQIM